RKVSRQAPFQRARQRIEKRTRPWRRSWCAPAAVSAAAGRLRCIGRCYKGLYPGEALNSDIRVGAVNGDTWQVFRSWREHAHVHLSDGSPNHLPLLHQNSVMRFEFLVDVVNSFVTWPQSQPEPTKDADAALVEGGATFLDSLREIRLSQRTHGLPSS